MNTRIAIFASGAGSNADNIIRYFQERQTASVELLLSNRIEAFALVRAADLGVESRYFPKADWADGQPILDLLREKKIDFIVLAGFLLRVPDCLTEAYPRRIVNIHPALLPKFGGRGMYGRHVHEAVMAAGEKESGITIHYINKEYDKGDTIFQTECPVLPDDTPERLEGRVHALEYIYFPRIIEQVVQQLQP